MLRAYKYRIYPTDTQKELLAKFFGSCRFVYNLGLETKIAAYITQRKKLSCFDLNTQLQELKSEIPWLKECPAQALQMSLRNLDNAYTGFFKGNKFPKFKAKTSKQSIQFPQGVKIKFKKSTIQIPKLKDIKCIYDRRFIGKIKTVTISKTTTGRYFVSVLVDNQKELPAKKQIRDDSAIGIDLGIKTLITMSNGTKIPNPRWFINSQKNLRIQQRSLSRMKKGSKRMEKQKLVIARIYEKIKNQRSDYLHKITSSIIKDFDTIVIEDLAVSNMVKNRKLSKAISDVSWGILKEMLTYKAEWHGKNIIEIGRFEPSSKICSVCGAINKLLQLSDRNWECNQCGIVHDRDINAAINIKKIGLGCKPSVANVIQ